MGQSVNQGDLLVTGNMAAKTLSLQQPSITDAMVVALAKLQASKLQHQYQPLFTQNRATNATVERRVIHVARGLTGTIVEVFAGDTTAGTGTSSVTIDVLKNGTSILTGTMSVTSALAAFALLSGTLSGNTYAVGDVFEVSVTAASAGSGALPTGLFVGITLREDAQ